MLLPKRRKLQNPHILVAYFSRSGNTRRLAEVICRQTGGRLFEIQPQNSYPALYEKTVVQAREEIQKGFLPALLKQAEGFDQYKTVFIGSPNWGGTRAPPVASFLAGRAAAGTILVPFCTHGGSGGEEIGGEIARLCPQARVLSAFEAYGPRVKTGAVKKQLGKWLRRIGMVR